MDRTIRTGRLIAGLVALLALVACTMAPMAIYRVVAGIPWSGHGPSWEGWLLVFGGGLGAGLARYIHQHVLTKYFSLDECSEARAWQGKN